MNKIVMVVDRELPLGLIANTTAVLGISLGRLFPEIVGADIEDADKQIHLGITNKTIPVLCAGKEQIKAIRERLFEQPDADLRMIDFCEIAQRSLDYAHYTTCLSALPCSHIYYLGICLYGPVKKVNKLTGSLGLLR